MCTHTCTCAHVQGGQHCVQDKPISLDTMLQYKPITNSQNQHYCIIMYNYTEASVKYTASLNQGRYSVPL